MDPLRGRGGDGDGRVLMDLLPDRTTAEWQELRAQLH
jgi:hypothetical protein